MASFQGIAGKARVCFHENNEAAVEGREIAHHPQHGFPLRIHDLHCANSSVGVRMKWAPEVVSTGQQAWTAAKVLWSLRRSPRARQVMAFVRLGAERDFRQQKIRKFIGYISKPS
jgi:hypothetical protein